MGLSISGVEGTAEASAQVRTEQMCQARTFEDLQCKFKTALCIRLYLVFSRYVSGNKAPAASSNRGLKPLIRLKLAFRAFVNYLVGMMAGPLLAMLILRPHKIAGVINEFSAAWLGAFVSISPAIAIVIGFLIVFPERIARQPLRWCSGGLSFLCAHGEIRQYRCRQVMVA